MSDEETETTQPVPPTVSSKARSLLRSMAHRLEPVVQLGGDGLSESVIEAVNTALGDHGLIKVRLGKSFAGERKASGRQLAEAVGADLTQVIGRVIVLYRPRPGKDDEKRPRIKLPTR